MSRVRHNFKRAVASLLTRNTAIILGYHGVSDQPLIFQNWIQMPKRLFAQHIEYLASNHRCITLSLLVDEIIQRKPLRRAVCITFDDGYSNVYKNVFPYLLKYSVPATIFLTVSFIDTHAFFWPDRIAFVLSTTKKQHLDFNGDVLPLSDPTQLKIAYRKIVNSLKLLHPNDIDNEILRLSKRANTPDLIPYCDQKWEQFRHLNWFEIQEMQQSGLVEFGSHTLNHSILSRLSLRDSFSEIYYSKALLEQNLKEINLFSYPNGTREDFTESHKNILRTLGFKAAVTTIDSRVTRSTDLYELPRYMIGDNCGVSTLDYYLFNEAIKNTFTLSLNKS